MLRVYSDLESFPLLLDLKRIEPEQRMRRFYRMTIQRDLFGRASLVREWGRIGFRGQILIESHDNVEMARSALMKLAQKKMKRGYVLTTKEGEEVVKFSNRAPNEGGRDAEEWVEEAQAGIADEARRCQQDGPLLARFRKL